MFARQRYLLLSEVEEDRRRLEEADRGVDGVVDRRGNTLQGPKDFGQNVAVTVLYVPYSGLILDGPTSEKRGSKGKDELDCIRGQGVR